MFHLALTSDRRGANGFKCIRCREVIKLNSVAGWSKDSLRLRWNHSVSIKSGYAGFTDFSSKDTGNAVDCLTNYFDYEFPDAVAALCEGV